MFKVIINLTMITKVDKCLLLKEIPFDPPKTSGFHSFGIELDAIALWVQHSGIDLKPDLIKIK